MVFWEKDRSDDAQIRTWDIQAKLSRLSMRTCTRSHVDYPTEHLLRKFHPDASSQLICNSLGASLLVSSISVLAGADGRQYSSHHHYIASITDLTVHTTQGNESGGLVTEITIQTSLGLFATSSVARYDEKISDISKPSAAMATTARTTFTLSFGHSCPIWTPSPADRLFLPIYDQYCNEARLLSEQIAVGSQSAIAAWPIGIKYCVDADFLKSSITIGFIPDVKSY